MQSVSISIHRFDGLRARAWAFSHMQWARAPLAALPGIGFWKLFGSGSGESFDPTPNFGVYAILACWPDPDRAREQVEQADIFRRYRDQAVETWSVFLDPVHSWGFWDGAEPFQVPPDREQTGKTMPQPLGVLTRATLRGRSLRQFWRSVPAISDMTAGRDGLFLKLGLGEVPWVHQVTFSVWRNMEAMRTFAYRSGPHKDAIKAARDKHWFKEELFARFAIRGHAGTWGGRDPLAGEAPASMDTAAA